MRRVSEKWGFGMAPPRPKTQSERNAACERLLQILSSKNRPDDDESILYSLSIVKGLFNRIVREDQWDWFTVSGQLGYPSSQVSSIIANGIGLLRTAIKNQNDEAINHARTRLCCAPTRFCLSVFAGRSFVAAEPGAGWTYVLSTREFPDLLKIGMTTRGVEQRTREINRATGVAIPFGVRRCWRVSNPTKAERAVHQRLHAFRLRDDREFFRVSFRVASDVIDAVLLEESIELRTLDALGGLSPMEIAES